jgi:circadian clock protein KaiC
MPTMDPERARAGRLPKAATGIQGLDEITDGGLPRGRPTLVCGSSGCGKTLLAIEFLVRGATEFGEPGVLMTFEETAGELAANVRPLGFDLDALIEKEQIAIDYVRVDRNEIEETGDYDLEGLFIRLGHAIDRIGAQRVVLDTIETLFSGLSNEGVLRAELNRLFRWLKDRGVTAVITGERGAGTLTRHGLEEYVSDCVILLDHRVIDQISTRRMRIVKYRGSVHGTNEYPFLIDEHGFSVLPITSLGLQHTASDERISSGIPRLDIMLGGQGFFRGSTVLVSGTAGSGKSSLAASFVDAACRRGERCLYFAFEESPAQIVRNMRSIGIDLEPWIDQELLKFHAVRSTLYGLEMHLASMHALIQEFRPQVVVVDPIGNLMHAGSAREANIMMTRLIDFLKSHQVTAFMTSLNPGGSEQARTELDVSSLVDAWLLLRDIELNGERNRAMYILKARGTAHSNQLREFLLTDHGVELQDVYVGAEGVLTGSARASQEARERATELLRQQEIEGRQRELERKRTALESRIAALRREFEVEEDELGRLIDQEQTRERVLRDDRSRMHSSRQGDVSPESATTRGGRGNGSREVVDRE